MSKSKSNAILTTVAIWFGCHIGGGFASGTMTRTYFTNFGWWAPIFQALAIILVGLTMREVLIGSRRWQTYDYHAWVMKAYAPYEKGMSVVMEVIVLYAFLMSTSGAISGCATLAEQFGANYFIGVAITGFALVLLTIFGSTLVSRASKIMMYILVTGLFILFLIGVIKSPTTINEAYKINVTSGFGATLWSCLKYAGIQSYVAFSVIPFASYFDSKEDITKATVAGILGNIIIACLACVAQLFWFGIIRNDPLPNFTISQTIGNISNVLYSTLLALAFISSGVACAFSTVVRYEKTLKFTENIKVRRILVAVIFLIVASVVSLVGLDALVSKGYGILGICLLITLIIPMFTFGHIQNRKSGIVSS